MFCVLFCLWIFLPAGEVTFHGCEGGARRGEGIKRFPDWFELTWISCGVWVAQCWPAGDPDAHSWYLNTFTEYLFRLMMPRELKGKCLNITNFSLFRN